MGNINTSNSYSPELNLKNNEKIINSESNLLKKLKKNNETIKNGNEGVKNNEINIENSTSKTIKNYKEKEKLILESIIDDSKYNPQKENLIILLENAAYKRKLTVMYFFLIYNFTKTFLWKWGYFSNFFYFTRFSSVLLAGISVHLINYDFELKMEKYGLNGYYNNMKSGISFQPSVEEVKNSLTEYVKLGIKEQEELLEEDEEEKVEIKTKNELK